MESNQNGNVDRSVNEVPDKSFRADWNEQNNYEYSAHHPQDHSQFFPSYDHSSSLPYNHHHTYHDVPSYTQTPFQPPHHTPQNPPYYSPQNQYNYQPQAQSIPNSSSIQNHNSHQAPYHTQYQSHSFPTQPQVAPYNQPTYTPTVPHHYGNDYRIETAPYQRESPMQRIQQLARQKHGGQLAAQNAAAAAAVAPRRISPTLRPVRKEKGGEETVRDVLQRQYLEQRRLEQMAQQQKQSLDAGFPNSYPSSSLIPSALSTPTHSSIFEAPRIDSPLAPSTPIFTFPLVTGARTPTSVSSPASALSSVVQTPPGEPLRAGGPDEAHGRKYSEVGDQMLGQLKTKSLISSLHKANTIAMQTNATVEEMSFASLHQAATIVQTLESKEKQAQPPPLPLTRKRTLDHSACPRGQGVREELNEKGKKVEKVYVLLHHCNIRDPEYDPRGVIKSMDEIEKDEKRDDMFTLSYSSAVCPYEMVDFRIKMPPRPASPLNSSPSSSSSSSSQ